MDLGDLKELFGDILVRFQRGEIDLPEALIEVRDMEVPDDEEPDDLDELDPDDPADPADPPPAEPVDQALLDAASAELDAALAMVPGASPPA